MHIHIHVCIIYNTRTYHVIYVCVYIYICFIYLFIYYVYVCISIIIIRPPAVAGLEYQWTKALAGPGQASYRDRDSATISPTISSEKHYCQMSEIKCCC